MINCPFNSGRNGAPAVTMKTDHSAGAISPPSSAIGANGRRTLDCGNDTCTPADRAPVSLVAPIAAAVRAANVRHGNEYTALSLAGAAGRFFRHDIERVGAEALAECAPDVFMLRPRLRGGRRGGHLVFSFSWVEVGRRVSEAGSRESSVSKRTEPLEVTAVFRAVLSPGSVRPRRARIVPGAI